MTQNNLFNHVPAGRCPDHRDTTMIFSSWITDQTLHWSMTCPVCDAPDPAGPTVADITSHVVPSIEAMLVDLADPFTPDDTVW